MNLFEALKDLKPTKYDDAVIPTNLFGAFRRKSITFFNGLTDENTIVYWFQSKSFTIDIRLKDTTQTPILDCQGWIGTTLWNYEKELLSWDIAPTASYQNHNQWPEPAKLHAIGNCFLEFSPSNVYVEDWRQQATQGLFLGLKLNHVEHLATQTSFKMDGGLIICGQHMAYAQSRLPDIQQQILKHENLVNAEKAGISLHDINSYEVSIGDDGQHKKHSTQSQQIGQAFDIENFSLNANGTLSQKRTLSGEDYIFHFHIDIYQPDYYFQTETETSTQSQSWLKQEHHHLMHHAKITI